MRCEEIEKLLSPLIDGELPAAHAREVREHLGKCPQCAREFRLLTSPWDALLAHKDIEPSPDFEERFWRRLRDEQVRVTEIRPAAFTWRRLFKWSPAIAAGFLLAFFAGWMSAGGGATPTAAVKPAPTAQTDDKNDWDDTLTTSELAFLTDYEMIEQIDLLKALPVLQTDELSNGEGGAK